MNLYESIKKHGTDLNDYTEEDFERSSDRFRELEKIKIRSGGLVGSWCGSSLGDDDFMEYSIKDRSGNEINRLKFNVNNLGKMSDKEFENLKINIDNELRVAMVNKDTGVSRVCPMCGKEHIMYVDSAKYNKYVSDGGFIQDIFPDLNPLEREFIKTGYCEDCQNKLFDNSYTSDKILTLDEAKKLVN